MNKLLDSVVRVAQKAGDAVMAVYNSDEFDVTQKGDDSPLTKADVAAHEVIDKGLKAISDYPILCEEGRHEVAGTTFWLVDPLDGTKEFIKRRDEFTVNIALVKDQGPVLGVVHAPALGVTYAAAQGEGAFKLTDGKKQPIQAMFGGDIPKVVTSKSHRTPETDEFLATIGPHEDVSIGSSLKLCLVAEGTAQLYPRLGPTWTWDTAAADAVVRVAGGQVHDFKDQPLVYPPKAVKNPYFLARTRDSKPIIS